MIVNHGFIPDEIQEEDYVLGSEQLAGELLQPTGQWDEYLPEVELQKRNGLETQNCTVYGTLNALEALYYRKYAERHNFSERYVGVLAETTPQGNSPHKVAEVIRKTSGVIDDVLLPFSEDINEWDEYYSPNPMSPVYMHKGKRWLTYNVFKHEWVFKNNAKDKQDRLKEALQYSPVGISVRAWKERNGLYWKDKGEQDTHWCVLYGYEEGEYWKIFDHYDDSFKRLEWDYDFMFAKRFHIEKKTLQRNWFEDLLKRLFLWARN